MATITGPTNQPIDREKVCPLLLRVFCSTSRHNNLAEYNRGNGAIEIILDTFLAYFRPPLPHVSFGDTVTNPTTIECHVLLQ